MKILVVSQYFYPESFRINTLCRELVNRGHDVSVLTAYPQYPYGKLYDGYGFDIPYEKIWHGVKIHRVKTYPRGKGLLGMMKNCVSFVISGNHWVRKCEEKFDVVFACGLSPVTLALPAVTYKKKFNVPLYYNLQDLWPESMEEVLGIRLKPIVWVISKIANRIYKNSEKILCTSRGYIPNLQSKGVKKEKLLFWPQFCLPPQIKNTKPIIFGEDTFNVVFTGNIGDAQGLDLMIEAAKVLKGNGIRWYLVGDGRAKDRLQALVQKYDLEKDVFFVGRVSEEEANQYVHYADCAYLSFQDNKLFNMILPAKLQTYLACGAPILAAAGGESAELIKEAGCGIAVEPELNQLIRAVKQMASSSKQTRKKMSENSLKYYEAHFQMNQLIDHLIKLMEK